MGNENSGIENQVKSQVNKDSAVQNQKGKIPPKKSKLGNKGIIIIALVILGLLAVAAYALYHPAATSPQNATVFIVSAVSGAAQVTDPTDNKTYDVTVDYYGISAGSGFIITSDGYIATAAHVVGDPWEITHNGVIRKMTNDDLKYYVDKAAIYIFLQKAHPEMISSLNESQLDTLTNQFMTAGAVKATNYTHNIYIRGPAFSESASNPVKAQLVDMGNSDTEMDVALLKVNKASRLPYLPINNQQITVGENVRIYGYPTEQFAFYGNMDTEGGSKELWNSIYTASLTSGIVSAERPSSKGTTYYQTDAAVDSGSSGGPVCNSNNQVVGILVQGFEKQGFNFFLPSKYITELCKENGVNVGGGSFLPF